MMNAQQANNNMIIDSHIRCDHMSSEIQVTDFLLFIFSALICNTF